MGSADPIDAVDGDGHSQAPSGSDDDPARVVSFCFVEDDVGDHAIAQDFLLAHAERGGVVHDERVDLLERVGVTQEREALACRELAGLVLALDPVGPPALLGGRLHLGQAIVRVDQSDSPPSTVRTAPVM